MVVSSGHKLTPGSDLIQAMPALWTSSFGKSLVIISHGSMRFIYVYVITNAYQTITDRIASADVRDASAQLTGLLLSACSGLASMAVFLLIQADIIHCHV
jgi:hypothetical protein